MANPKPTIVLVPGAWHSPDGFKPTTSILESAGYTCIGVPLASVGAPTPLKGIEEDVEGIRSVIKAEIEAEHDVVVFMHSYGGVPGGEAVKDLDKASVRKDGGRGGVAHLIYCTAFAPPKGTSLMSSLGGNPLPWFEISEDEKIVNPATPDEIFYGDLDDESKKAAIAQLKPHSFQTFHGKTTWEAYRDIPSTYLYCTEDKAIPYEAQKGMVAAAPGKFKEETIQGASHSPFMSRPKETADAVRRAAGETL